MAGAFSYGMTPSNSPKGSAFQAVQPSVMPVGIVEMFAGATAPNGWLVCDGSAVSRKTYGDLFKVIGITWGAGNSNDTFTLPDMRGRMPLGAGLGYGLNSSGSGAISGAAQTVRTVGQWLGEETHLLTTAELASHTHANTVGGASTSSVNQNAAHTHVLATRAGSSGTSYYRLYDRFADASNVLYTESTNTDHTHTFTPTIANVGSGSDSRHSTMPPAVVINFIIKT